MNCTVKCPFCNTQNSVSIDWIKKNGRIFCPVCCKSFDISVKEEDNEEDGIANIDAEDYW